jgi:phosphate transport system protein
MQTLPTVNLPESGCPRRRPLRAISFIAPLRAFVSRDVHVARAVDGDADAIDKLNREVFEATLCLEAGRKEREVALRQVLVARCLERIGDNAVDVAEQALFLVTAQHREHPAASHPKTRH